MRIGLVGFGLIGGSLARALHARDVDATLVAWSPSLTGPRRAVVDGVLAEAAETIEAAVRGADIVVLAAPPLASLEILGQLAGPLRVALGADSTITDVVSTKARLVALADATRLPFVGGHPMAGRETTGYEAADHELFVGRPWVVVPSRAARAADVARVEWLARAAGAYAIHLGASEHDAAVAAISHLPLVLAASLVEAVVGPGSGETRPDWDVAKTLAAGGWRDMTRLARGDVEMGAGIAATNAAPLASRLRDVRAVLDGWIASLDAIASQAQPDATAIAARLRDARNRLDRG